MWADSFIADRLEVIVTISVNEQIAGHKVTVRPAARTKPTPCQLRMRLGVSDRQYRRGHARDPNPPGRSPRSYPAASGTADQAWLQELPALTLASPGRRWMRSTPALVVPPCGVAVKARASTYSRSSRSRLPWSRPAASSIVSSPPPVTASDTSQPLGDRSGWSSAHTDWPMAAVAR